MRHPRRSSIRAAFLLYLIAPSAAFGIPFIARQTPYPIGQTATPRPDDHLVILTVTVTDKKGNYIDGLDKSAFTIYENKVPQDISFFAAKDEPASIGIIFDLSNSLVEHERERLEAVRDALLRFIRLNRSENEYFVIGFTSRAQLLIDWTRDSKVVGEGLNKLDFTFRRGNTALYDACYLGVEKMGSSTHLKRAILLISDGQDNDSHYTFENVRERLRGSGVLLYSIGIIGANDPGFFPVLESRYAMNGLSSISGGIAVFPDSKKKIEAAFDQIAIELRHQYLLGFSPTSARPDGKWHQLKIKVTPPPTAPPQMSKLYVRSREGYRAVKNLR